VIIREGMGRLMASAVHQQAVPKVLEDVLSFGEGQFTVAERKVDHGEAGTLAFDLPDLAGNLILGVVRNGRQYPFPQLKEFALRPGDAVVYLVGSTSSTGEVPDAPPDR
jgi:hypothetical protein